MMSIHGYDGYDLFHISSFFFNSANYRFSRTFLASYAYRRINGKMRMIENEDIASFLNSRDLKDKVYENKFFMERMRAPTDGESLYFDKACTIPRMKCVGKWKRARKVANADVVVVPEFCMVKKLPSCAVFVDNAARNIYVMEGCDNIKRCPKLGDTVWELVQEHMPYISKESLASSIDSVRKAADARCVYVGNLMMYDNSNEFIFKIIDGVYPKFVFEKDLLQLLGTEEERFTTESIQCLVDLVSSNDEESVLQGIRILASMDYYHYPSVAKYVLKMSHKDLTKYKSLNNTIKFMFDHLGINSRNRYINNPFKSVTREEFPVIRNLVIDSCRKRIDDTVNLLRTTVNLRIDFDYSLDVRFDDPQAKDSSKGVNGDIDDSIPHDWHDQPRGKVSVRDNGHALRPVGVAHREASHVSGGEGIRGTKLS